MYVAYFPISSHVFLVLCFKFVILDNISTALLANSLNLSKFFCCCCHFVLVSFWMVLVFFFAVVAKSLQSCLTLCNPIDSSPPVSPIPGILQARTLEWVAISFSNAWQWKVRVKSLSHVRLLATPWTAAHQAPPSMGFSRQEYWSGVPLPSLILFVYLVVFLC